jgi:hypothetical protein
MKIVNFLSPGDRRAFKKGQSDMGEYACLGGSGSKVLSPQEGKIGAWGTEGNAISPVVSPRTGKVIAPCNVALEVVNA